MPSCLKVLSQSELCCEVKMHVLKDCPLFGTPKPLSTTVLPTIADTLRFYSYIHHDMVLKQCLAVDIKKQIVSQVADMLIKIWISASIPTISLRTVCDLIIKFQNERKSILKSFKRDEKKTKFITKVALFVAKTNALLDLASCKCKDWTLCNCEKENRVSICVIYLYYIYYLYYFYSNIHRYRFWNENFSLINDQKGK